MTGLSIVLPPRGERPKLAAAPKQPGGGKPSFVIGKIVADDARLELLTDKPGKFPLLFDIVNLVMDSAGLAEPGDPLRRQTDQPETHRRHRDQGRVRSLENTQGTSRHTLVRHIFLYGREY